MVDLLVSLDLGKRVAAAKNLQVPDEIRPQQLEQSLEVPASTEYAKLWGEWIDLLQVLGQQLPPAELSDESLLAVYDALTKTGAIDGGMSVADVRQAFGDGGFVRSATALSAALEEEAAGSTSRSTRVSGTSGAVDGEQGSDADLLLAAVHQQAGPVTDISTLEPLPSSDAPSAGGPAPDEGTAS